MPRLLTAAALLLTAVLVALPRPPDAARPSPDLTAPAVADEVIVRLRPPFLALPDAVLSQRLDGEVASRLPELASVRLRLLKGETPAEAVARIGRLPDVEFVEPNHLVRAAKTPNDPLYVVQSSYLDLIDAPAAWDVEMGSDAVLVAVLDSGIDLTHPDLQSRIWTNLFETDGNGVDDDNDGCVDDAHGCSFVTASTSDPSCPPPSPGAVEDLNGHGTFVSGIIAAQGNNGLGVVGAAPGVTILPVKILDCTGGGTAAEAAQAVLYAARLGARVANISFGADGESLTLANAIREAANRYGVVIVAATGNAGERGVTFPARLPQALAIASSGTTADPNVRSPFSDWGPEVAFAAPGINIVSTVPARACGNGWSCLPEGSYAMASGTSFAAPLVSALAALLISHTPNLSPEVVRRIITASAQPLPDGATPNWDGAGRVHMRVALAQPRYYLGAPGAAKQ